MLCRSVILNKKNVKSSEELIISITTFLLILFSILHDKRIHEHGLKILTLLGWQPFNQASREHLTKYIIHHTQNQLLPKQVFLLSVDFCWQHKIELPTYNTLAELITSAYNNFELTHA